MSHQHNRRANVRVRVCEIVRVCPHRFCIFQADNLSILSTPDSTPESLFSSWHDGGTAGGGERVGKEGSAGLRSVAFGRKIMSLFKDRKFSFARAWKIDFCTLSSGRYSRRHASEGMPCADFTLLKMSVHRC